MTDNPKTNSTAPFHGTMPVNFSVDIRLRVSEFESEEKGKVELAVILRDGEEAYDCYDMIGGVGYGGTAILHHIEKMIHGRALELFEETAKLQNLIRVDDEGIPEMPSETEWKADSEYVLLQGGLLKGYRAKVVFRDIYGEKAEHIIYPPKLYKTPEEAVQVANFQIAIGEFRRYLWDTAHSDDFGLISVRRRRRAYEMNPERYKAD